MQALQSVILTIKNKIFNGKCSLQPWEKTKFCFNEMQILFCKLSSLACQYKNHSIQKKTQYTKTTNNQKPCSSKGEKYFTTSTQERRKITTK